MKLDSKVESDKIETSTIYRSLDKAYEYVTLDLITRLYVLSAAFSCVIDPSIYAFWYKPFKKCQTLFYL